MFDDQQPVNPGTTPSNLPIGEPEDIFASTDEAASSVPEQNSGVSLAGDPGFTPEKSPSLEASSPSTALGAGILRPKMPSPPAQDPVYMQSQVQRDNKAQEPVAKQDRYTMQSPMPGPTSPQGTSMMPGKEAGAPPIDMLTEPIGKRKTITIIIIIIFLLVIGIGGTWIYLSVIRTADNNRLIENADSDASAPSLGTVDSEDPFLDELDKKPEIKTPSKTTETKDTSEPQTIDENVLFGDTVLDTDADGLDDVKEVDTDTDPLNWDSDGDELSDGDEVLIWKTNPLNPDTDGDTYEDGVEVKNGYNPAGKGKLFEPPTSTLQ